VEETFAEINHWNESVAEDVRVPMRKRDNIIFLLREYCLRLLVARLKARGRRQSIRAIDRRRTVRKADLQQKYFRTKFVQKGTRKSQMH
jgi:hypothetical protein